MDYYDNIVVAENQLSIKVYPGWAINYSYIICQVLVSFGNKFAWGKVLDRNIPGQVVRAAYV